MSAQRTASIIITSHNYARFLRAAIDSALAQTWPAVEVIVVDDGSTDESPRIIQSYGSRIRPILKENAGQASAINEGFAAGRGDVVLLLDSDDLLEPSAIEYAMPFFDDSSVMKVHWPMTVIDEAGEFAGRIVPSQPLSDGNLRDVILRDGPEAYEWPPTSGNAWRRQSLQRVLPIPEQHYRVCPDVYLAAIVGVTGAIRRIDQPQSRWRIHGQNNTWHQPFEERLPRFMRQWDLACEALVEYCRAQHLPADPDRWRSNAWCHRVWRTVEILCSFIPDNSTFILIDGNDWGASDTLFSRRCLPFPQRDGHYWGLPTTDQAACDELNRLRRAGAHFLALAWPCFWWSEHYPGFMRFVRERFSTLVDNADLVLFDLRNREP